MRKLLAVLVGTLVFVGLIPSQSQATAQKLPQDGTIILDHPTLTVGPANLDTHTAVPAPEVWTDADSFIEFVAPGATKSPPAPPPPPLAPFAFVPGTTAYIINQLGAVAGFYVDAEGVYYGYLRAPDGTFTTKINAPGADTTAGHFSGTFPTSLNVEGAMLGYYCDKAKTCHGFLRARDGKFTAFDVPGAGTGSFQGTVPWNINLEGEISGDYSDENGAYHGFLRARDGTITTFDVPGAGKGSGQGTFTSGVTGLNEEGATAGWYVDAGNVYHAYVRARDGTITTFDPPGAGKGPFQGTFTVSINLEGAVPGVDGD